jgi:hypothetical protein
MLGRRLLLLSAILLGLTLVATALAPPPAPAPRDAPTVTSGGARAPDAGGLDPVEVTLDVSSGERDVEVAAGDLVRLEVRSDRLDAVELRGLGLVRAVAPDSPAQFEIYADRAGDYPLVLVESGATVGTLRVSAP